MSMHPYSESNIAAALRDLEDGVKQYEGAPITGQEHYEATGYLLGAVRVAMKKMESAMRLDAATREAAAE